MKNTRLLDELGIPFIMCTPLIPGVTDSDENLEQIADSLQSLHNPQCCEPPNFNPLGNGKYDALPREDPFAEHRPLPQQQVQVLLGALEQEHLAVKLA